VKIAPNYNGPVIYVTDASRAVAVAQSLITPEAKDKYVADTKAEYRKLRELHASKKALPLISLEAARANRLKIDWNAYAPPQPRFIGRRIFKNYDLAQIARFIDWGPFFKPGNCTGRFRPFSTIRS